MTGALPPLLRVGQAVGRRRAPGFEDVRLVRGCRVAILHAAALVRVPACRRSRSVMTSRRRDDCGRAGLAHLSVVASLRCASNSSRKTPSRTSDLRRRARHGRGVSGIADAPDIPLRGQSPEHQRLRRCRRRRAREPAAPAAPVAGADSDGRQRQRVGDLMRAAAFAEQARDSAPQAGRVSGESH